MFNAPTLTCTICQTDALSFGMQSCPRCSANIYYDTSGSVRIWRFLGAAHILKLADKLFLGLGAILILIMATNLITDAPIGTIIGSLISLISIAICYLAIRFVYAFVVNKMISDGAVSFSPTASRLTQARASN